MSDELRPPLDHLVGAWIVEATHPALPGVVVDGTADIEWLEGERFLIYRSRLDHPDFPDAIAVIGSMDHDRVDDADTGPATDSRLTMHYFDSRGVFRVYQASVDDEAWRLWRNAPGFSQRFVGSFTEGGNVIAGRWQFCEDDIRWKDDLLITYRRR